MRPQFVWQAGRVGGRRTPPVILSTLHLGYVFSGLSLALDAALLWHVPGERDLLLPALHLVWISAVFSLVALNPSFLEDLNGRPLERLGVANQLTLSRLCFLPSLVYAIWRHAFLAALIGYLILGLTDIADGWMARRRGEESKLGFVLDPLSDILFYLGIFTGLAAAQVLPLWVAALVWTRYLLLLVGSLVLYLWKGEIWIRPTRFGKASGLVIATLTAFVVLSLGTGVVDPLLMVHVHRSLGWLFSIAIAHVFVIGWINFRRPMEGGTAVYRRALGLLVGRRAESRPDDGTEGQGSG